MESDWKTLRVSLQALVDSDVSVAHDGGWPEADVIDAFVALYDAHIHTEEQLVYPAAAALLLPARVAVMSADMMHRRGVKKAV
jgi:hypothetical protein